MCHIEAMTTVDQLFAKRGTLSAIAREVPCSVQTAHAWKRNRSIPTWRRSAVLDAVRRLKLDLPDEVIAYLVRP